MNGLPCPRAARSVGIGVVIGTVLALLPSARLSADAAPRTGTAPEAPASGPTSRPAKADAPIEPVGGDFFVGTAGEARAAAREEGRLCLDLVHTDHLGGTKPGDWLAKFRARPDWARRSVTLVYCRAGHDDIAPTFAPCVHQMIMWGFANVSDEAPDENEPRWPGLDHPFANHLRVLRRNVSPARLITAVPAWSHDKGSISMHPIMGNRPPETEETHWMWVAAIGADADGVAWMNDAFEREQSQLGAWTRQLRPHAEQLGRARPVRWCRAETPVSALASDRTLFVLLLNPRYMVVRPSGRIAPPLDASPQRGQVVLDEPDPGSILGARYLSGRSLRVSRTPDGKAALRYTYRGGGEMIVVRLMPRNERPSRRRTMMATQTDDHGSRASADDNAVRTDRATRMRGAR